METQRHVLPNGLVFLYRQSPGIPLAAGTLLLPSGSLDETAAQAGLANLTLEVLPQGTRRLSARKITDRLESMGASLGVQVAEDHTDIGFSVPIGRMEQTLEILVSMLVEPTFLPEEIKKEREGVLAGLKSREDSLFNRAYDTLNEVLYGSHPYGRTIDGYERTVRKFTRSQMLEWYRAHVRPDGAFLSVVSSFPSGQVQKIIEKHFRAWKPRGLTCLTGRQAQSSKLSRNLCHTKVTPLRGNKEVSLKARFEQAYLMIGVQAPSALDSAYAGLKVLNTLLGGGMSSRLFLKLREEMGLAYEVSSFYPTHLAASQWVFYMGLPPGKLAVARKAMEAELDLLRREGPNPEEVRQAVEMIKGTYLMEHQTRARVAWYAAWWELLGKGYEFDRQFVPMIESVTVEEVRTLARRLLDQPRVTVEVTPKK
jgi:zinc protease